MDDIVKAYFDRTSCGGRNIFDYLEDCYHIRLATPDKVKLRNRLEQSRHESSGEVFVDCILYLKENGYQSKLLDESSEEIEFQAKRLARIFSVKKE